MEAIIEEKEIWRNKPLTEFKPEKIEYVGKKKIPTAEVQIEEVKPKKIEPKGQRNDFSRVVLGYQRLKEMLNLLGSLVTEAKFKLDQNGMTCIVVDPAHVGMIKMNMPKDTFAEFVCEGEAYWTLDIRNLNKTLPKAKPMDVVTLSGRSDTLTVETGPFKRDYKIMDPEYITTPRVPPINPEFSFIIGQYEMKNALVTADPVSDSIRLTMDNNGVVFLAEADSEKAEAVYTKEMLKEVNNGGNKIRSTYPLEYLEKLFKAMKTVDEVRVRFQNEYPMVIDFNVKGTFEGSEGVSYTYFLAPRMEQ